MGGFYMYRPRAPPPERRLKSPRTVSAACVPNTTKTWTRVVANGPGCVGTPCDVPGHQIGWGADRLTFYAEQQTWETPLLCADQDMHITQARRHVDQIINDILRPATMAIQSNFLRKRVLQWAKKHNIANSTLSQFTYQWTLAGPNLDEEQYFDCNINPNNVYHARAADVAEPLLAPDAARLRRQESVQGHGALHRTRVRHGHLPQPRSPGRQPGRRRRARHRGNWRFEQWGAANEYWRYGFSGQIGNFMVRVDEMGLRFNFVTDLGAAANGGNGNRYRYQVCSALT